MAALAAILTPFFYGDGGSLAESSSINSPGHLEKLKDAILGRYVEDERAFKAGSLTAYTWEKRRRFLVNRYIDTARRLDYLQHIGSQTLKVQG